MEENKIIKEQTMEVPTQYKPLSAWAYFGYQILFSVPIIGFIFLIVFAFNNDNINRRNFARSYFCSMLLAFILIIIIIIIIATVAGTVAVIPGIDTI